MLVQLCCPGRMQDLRLAVCDKDAVSLKALCPLTLRLSPVPLCPYAVPSPCAHSVPTRCALSLCPPPSPPRSLRRRTCA